MANEPITLTKLMGKPDFVPEKRMEATAEKIILAHLPESFGNLKVGGGVYFIDGIVREIISRKVGR